MTVAEQIKLYEETLFKMWMALAFYGDPDTYFAINILPDRPCGAFAEDYSFDESYDRDVFGKHARDTLEALCKDQALVEMINRVEVESMENPATWTLLHHQLHACEDASDVATSMHEVLKQHFTITRDEVSNLITEHYAGLVHGVIGYSLPGFLVASLASRKADLPKPRC